MVAQYPKFTFNYLTYEYGQSLAIQADCFDWLSAIPEYSIHAIVTDPPYGVREYEFDQLDKRSTKQGGIWRIPPAFDGSTRSPLPRFTALSDKERKNLYNFFVEWTKIAIQPICPGGHLLIASNTFLSQLVFQALVDGGLEYRGTVIRLVRTLRGGDRPKNAEVEFDEVCSMPRGCFEPWGIFRKPLLKGMKVSDCLKEFGTGGLRRKPDGNPFEDVIPSERTPQRERKIVEHPSLKPQSFLRQIVYASLPLGKGIVVDPFMGSGSTIAAAEAMGYRAIGIERYQNYFEESKSAIPQLAKIYTESNQLCLEIEGF
ncbi:site-specific DNA-methyltransferase [Desertifilum sp. FACHB-1129]|uniref:DNA-methyltransferase n=1 Tax=unclassified Desertifilum TaxID=2621682 RepID=UPI0009F42724|nr:DNA methyltransferase [Desertifilum tharense]MBD2310414.1 site-specific DNA-methyltransferase [Desertifilum sp. FACHB-1129]MBD2321866.1 site-specific DNA-methyltransferase [Desertifilum sp. FACHB-866]MBD2331993.1 site-specific DNA-methyltransferase [Desertifilum sp. FACHB-868]MDA0208931.1 DNA methyltransferase [Cyanobacteria bacterium FC1]